MLMAKSGEPKMKSSSRRRSGQILVLVTIAMVVLIGFASMAVDIGLLYATRRRMQTAADAAAIAGASALLDGENYQDAAYDVATLDGFTSGQNNITVSAAPPAAGDPNLNLTSYSTSNYVEVDITQNVPTYFLRVLGYQTMKVAARAVAGPTQNSACVYVLDPTASQTLSVTGNANVTVQCGVMDDSSSSSGLSLTGNITLTATSIGVTGASYSSSGNITVTPAVSENVPSLADPLAGRVSTLASSLKPPGCTQASGAKSGSYSLNGNISTQTIGPLLYAGGVSVSGNVLGSLTFTGGTWGNQINFDGNGGNLIFNPGQYQNGSGSGYSVNLNGNTGTTFNSGSYTFCGPVDIVGNSAVTLQPGTYYGGIQITGNANVTFSPGTYVLAGGGFSVTGNSTLTGNGVTFYNTSATGFAYAPIDLTGNETAKLSAPTSGNMEALLFVQDPSIAKGSSGITVVGNSSSSFDGIIYSPTTALTYVGNSSGSGYTVIIAYTLTTTGNSNFTIGSNYSSLSNGAPIQQSKLYE
jgi:Putative Flp pilus-assembly TadE/G-like